MKRIFISITIIVYCLAIGAETREHIAAISNAITADGNFRYWSSESPTIAKLKAYINNVCTEGSTSFVPKEDRIAVFDMDGTLVSETVPYWSECMMFLYHVLDDTTYTASQKDIVLAREIRNAVLSGRSTLPYYEAYDEAAGRVFSGICTDEYAQCVQRFMNTDVPKMTNMKWGEIFFLPMVEVVAYLRANGFTTYIVTGSDRQFTRQLVGDILKVDANHIIGTDVAYTLSGQGSTPADSYQIQANDQLVRGKADHYNSKSVKVTNIYREIGKRPLIAFGNTSGDYSMLTYTKGNKYLNMEFLVLPDDIQREYGDTAQTTKYRNVCISNGWNAISMKDEFKSIYGCSQKK